MRRFAFLLILFPYLSISLHADDMNDTNIALEAGYRHDHFQILTNPTDNPLIVTNQDWKNVQSWTLGINADTYTEYNVYIKGKISFGWAYKSDFFWETPLLDSNIFSPKAGPHGRNYDAKIAVGFPCWLNCFGSCSCFCESWRFIPLIGFSWDRMDFESHGRFEDDIGILKTKSHNRVVIYSPYIGLDLHIPWDCWRIYAGYEYHRGRLNSHAEFKGENSFKLRTHDTGKGYGNVINAGIGYQFWCDYEAFISFSYTDWKTEHGHDKTRFTFNNTITDSKIHLRKADWQSWSIAFDFICLY